MRRVVPPLLVCLSVMGSGMGTLIACADAPPASEDPVPTMEACIDWWETLENPGAEAPTAIAVDSSGRIYTAGVTRLGWGGAPSTQSLTPFTAAWSPQGELLWLSEEGPVEHGARRDIWVGPNGDLFGAGENDINEVYAVRTDAEGGFVWQTSEGDGADLHLTIAAAGDPAGNTYVTGWTRMGSWGGVDPIGAYDITLTKFDPNGELVWATLYGTESRDEPADLDVDDEGDIYIVGVHDQRWGDPEPEDWGPAFLSKWTTDAELVWTWQAENAGDYQAVAVDGRGGAYVAGRAGELMFVAHHDEDGHETWRAGVPANRGGSAYDLTVDDDANAYVVGYVSGAIEGFENLGGDDLAVAKFNPDGELEWAQQFGGPADDSARGGIAVGAKGSVYVFMRQTVTDLVPDPEGDVSLVRLCAPVVQ